MKIECIGQYVQQARERQKMSRRELIEKMRVRYPDIRFGETALRDLEKLHRIPRDWGILEAVAYALDMNLAQLLERSGALELEASTLTDDEKTLLAAVRRGDTLTALHIIHNYSLANPA